MRTRPNPFGCYTPGLGCVVLTRPLYRGGEALTLPHLARAFPQHVFRLGLSRYGADLELLTIDTFRCLCTTDSPHEVLIKLHLIIVGTGGRIKDEPP